MKRTMNANSQDILLFKKYVSGNLEHDMMHQLEKRAMDDPFLWDALEGFEQVENPAHDLSLLQSNLHKRVAYLQEQRESNFFNWQRISIAATASVLFILSGILFWMNVSRRSVNGSAERHVEVNLSTHESIKSEIYSSINSGSAIQPVAGWNNYQVYMKKNLRRAGVEPALNGSVVLSFRLNDKGQPIDIAVLKGLSKSSNEEAVRLVKEGPLWKSEDGFRGNVKLEVPF